MKTYDALNIKTIKITLESKFNNIYDEYTEIVNNIHRLQCILQDFTLFEDLMEKIKIQTEQLRYINESLTDKLNIQMANLRIDLDDVGELGHKNDYLDFFHRIADQMNRPLFFNEESSHNDMSFHLGDFSITDDRITGEFNCDCRNTNDFQYDIDSVKNAIFFDSDKSKNNSIDNCFNKKEEIFDLLSSKSSKSVDTHGIKCENKVKDRSEKAINLVKKKKNFRSKRNLKKRELHTENIIDLSMLEESEDKRDLARKDIKKTSQQMCKNRKEEIKQRIALENYITKWLNKEINNYNLSLSRHDLIEKVKEYFHNDSKYFIDNRWCTFFLKKHPWIAKHIN